MKNVKLNKKRIWYIIKIRLEKRNLYRYICFTSNAYFANLFGVKPKAISVTIKKLKDLDLINVKYIRNENLVKQRSITLKSNVWKGISNNEVVNKEEEITYMKEYNNKKKYLIKLYLMIQMVLCYDMVKDVNQ